MANSKSHTAMALTRIRPSLDACNLAAAKPAIFLVAHFLINLGYFLGLSKSVLEPRTIVPYLGFLSDSSLPVFHLIPAKREKFVALVRQVLSCSRVSVKTLQKLAGKCVSFSLAVPGAILFTREMNNAIAKGLRSGKQVQIYDALRDEIAHWLFLENWDDPLPWRDERHFRVALATDASSSGWGGSVSLPNCVDISDYWMSAEQGYDIATKEALALNKVLLSLSDALRTAWVDAHVDNQAVIHAWQKQGCRSVALNSATKQLFFTTMRLNLSLHLFYVPSSENPADAPSRRMSSVENKLHPTLWDVVQSEFGGSEGHTVDLMALDSNAMTDLSGVPLSHFTPCPSPASSGVNLFAQDLSSGAPFMKHPYIFSPIVLVGSVLRFLQSHQRSCTLVTLDVYPRKYWWPLIQRYANKSRKLARKGDTAALYVPSRNGWVPHHGIPLDLWAFALCFSR